MRKLYFGLSGSDVKELQMKLEVLGYADFIPSGFYGAKTHIAVRAFQKAHNLPATGVFGATEASLMGIVDKITKSDRFFAMCLANLNTDVTPKDKVDDDVACCETIDTLLYKTFGEYMAGSTITISTTKALEIMSISPKFLEIQKPIKGSILVYATGTGNGYLSNGHIFASNGAGLLYSNSSYTGLFQQNYTDFTAKYRYETLGGFKPHYFMLI